MPEKLKRGQFRHIASWKIGLLFLAGATTGTCTGVTLYGTYKAIQEARASESLFPGDGVFIFGPPRTPERSPTPDYFASAEANRRAIENADDGDVLSLDNVVVMRVMRITLPGVDDLHFAMLGIVAGQETVDGKLQTLITPVAGAHNANCITRDLGDEGLQPLVKVNPFGRVWEPMAPYDSINVTVSLQQLGDLPAGLRVDQIDPQGEKLPIICPHNPTIDIPGLGQIANIFGSELREIFDEFNRGLSGN